MLQADHPVELRCGQEATCARRGSQAADAIAGSRHQCHSTGACVVRNHDLSRTCMFSWP